MSRNYQAVISAPFGALGVCMEHGVLSGIDFLPADTPLIAPIDDAAAQICRQLSAYLQNPDTLLDMPILPSGTDFQQRVWQALQAIPIGATLTYAELAERVGSGARAVANACGANPIPLVIPCHRVVAKNGLGGFMQGREANPLSIKRWLLAHEGR